MLFHLCIKLLSFPAGVLVILSRCTVSHKIKHLKVRLSKQLQWCISHSSESCKNLEKQNTDITDDKILSKGLSFLHQWLEKTFGKQIKLFDTEGLNKNLNIDSEIPPTKMENPLKIKNENADIIIEYSIEEYNKHVS